MLTFEVLICVVIGAALVMMGWLVGYIHGRVSEYARWSKAVNNMHTTIIRGLQGEGQGRDDVGGDTPK